MVGPTWPHMSSSLPLYPLSPLSSAPTLPIHALLNTVAADADPHRVVLVFGGRPIRVGAELLDAVPSLRCIITISAGINHIDLHTLGGNRGGPQALGRPVHGSRPGMQSLL